MHAELWRPAAAAPIVTLIFVVVLDLVAPVPFLPRGVSLVVGIPLLALGLGPLGMGHRPHVPPGREP